MSKRMSNHKQQASVHSVPQEKTVTNSTSSATPMLRYIQASQKYRAT